ncbi:hypothetical protein D1BOALGB6SA_1045 [Olavius sp. associated proteobacterium Delta 1]|nr:hypothetical protein D1BOALGB6SA_1045 [Olavius sp. associated proteobacterium Delta 1]
MANATMMNASINATMNATNSSSTGGAVEPLLWNLSTQAVIILCALIVCVTSIVIVGLLRPKQAKSPTNKPFIRALLFTMLMIVFIIVTEGLGWYGPEGMPWWMKAALIILTFFLALTLPKSEAQKVQERTEVLFPDRIKGHQKERYDAVLNVGDSSGSQIPHYRVLPNNDRYGGGDDHIAHYLIQNNHNQMYVYAFGTRTEVMVEVVEDPSPEYIKLLFARHIKPYRPTMTVSRNESVNKHVGGAGNAVVAPATS